MLLRLSHQNGLSQEWHYMRKTIAEQLNGIKNAKNKYEFCKKIALCCEKLSCSDLPLLFNYIKKEKNTAEFISEFGECKIAILSNFTVDMIAEYLKISGLSRGVSLTTYYPGYNQYAFEISDNNSQLYQLNPDYICLILDETAIFQEYACKQKTINKIKEFSSYYIALLEKLRSSTGSKIIINSINLSKHFLYSYIDYESRMQILLEISKLNQRVLEFSLTNKDIFVIDMNLILQHENIGCIRDERLALYAKIQMTDEILRQIAIETIKIISSTNGYSKKCIALDLDNTLWGGILGDDGSDRIDIGETVTGNEFKQLQKLLKHIKNQGIVLAINSKNDAKNVEDVFSDNREMVLLKDDFINIKSNWRSKHDNLVEIANESNISKDSILFIDDSDVECAMVENFLPEINTMCAKEGPLSVMENIIISGYFDKVKSSKEDIIRTEMYQNENNRKTFLSSVDSISKFLEELNINVDIFLPDYQDIPRLHQMVLRTNQFNLTTKRYSEGQIEEFINFDSQYVIAAKVSDKFGPYGLVSAAFLKIEGDSMIIDNFLLSCRVFSRGIEDVMISEIMRLAKLKNIKIVKGLYIRSARNDNISNFYTSKGFDQENKDKDRNIFKKKVGVIPKSPEWITVKTTLKSIIEENAHEC